MDCSGRALLHTLGTEFTLLRIYPGQIVLYDNCIMRTYLDALGATYAGRLARLAGHCPLVFTVACHHDLEAAGALCPEFNDTLGAGFGAGAATGTLLLVHNRQSGFRIHPDGVKLACTLAVTSTQTSIAAGGIPTVKRSLDLTRSVTVVDIYRGAVFT